MRLFGVLLIYNILYPFALLAMLPRFIWKMFRRGNYRHKFGQRFAVYSRRVREKLDRDGNIWVHAVSVGEVFIALKVIKEIRNREPDASIVLSTTTSTGFALARERAGEFAEVIYNPVDFWFTSRHAVKSIRPRRLVLVEAEVWPNLVFLAGKSGARVSLVNARLSDRSERRFHKFRAFTSPIFGLLDHICVQEESDVGRWKRLIPVARHDAIHRVGSIKFDHEADDHSPAKGEALASLLHDLWGGRSRRVFLAGSTHPGEEKLLAEVYRALAGEFEDLFFLVVPRHFERAGDALADLRAAGLRPMRRTHLKPGGGEAPEIDTLLVDTTGELRAWYATADAVVIGKSFAATGGQNPVEAVLAGKPVFFGPHMENFREVVKALLDGRGAFQAADTGDLQRQVENVLRDPELARAVAGRGIEALSIHNGATRRTIDLVL